MAATPEHWCRVPELEPWTQDYVELVKNLSIPIDHTSNSSVKYAQCTMYLRNYTDIVRYLEYRTPYELQVDKVWDIGDPRGSPVVRCQNGWHYERDVYPNTAVTEVGKFLI